MRGPLYGAPIFSFNKGVKERRNMDDEITFLKSNPEDYDAYLDLALSSEKPAVKDAMEQASEKTPKESN